MAKSKEILDRSENRGHILAVAADVFLREGFERASVDKVAGVAHVSKQSIYELFPSKIDLFEAAVRDALARAEMATMRVSEDAEETLRRYAMRMFQAFSASASFGLFRANIAAARVFPSLAADLHQIRLDASAPVAAFFDKLIAQGRIKSCDTRNLAVRYGGTVVGGTRYFLGRSLPPLKEQRAMVDAVLEMVFNGYSSTCEWAVGDDGPGEIAPPTLDGSAALRLSSEKLTALVDGARKNFLEFGYVRTSVDRIAAEQGVSKATIYRQFGNKEKLFRYVIERDIFETAQVVIASPATGSLEEKISRIGRDALELHLSPVNIGMHQLLIEEADLCRDLAKQFYDVRLHRLGSALAIAFEEHGRPSPGPIGSQIFYSLATFAVRYLTARSLPDEETRAALSQSCARLFIHGVGIR